MRRSKALIVAGALAAIVAVPGQMDAQVGYETILNDTYVGGTNFSTSMSVNLRYNPTTGSVLLDIANLGGAVDPALNEVFTRIALVNLESDLVVTAISPPEGDEDWDSPTNLSEGDGIPGAIFGYDANASPVQRGLQPGESMQFEFGLQRLVNNVLVIPTLIYVSETGVGVHAQGDYDCSTKFAVWNGGDSDNDQFDGPYDERCQSVPEPGGGSLLAVGLAGLAFITTRRRDRVEFVD